MGHRGLLGLLTLFALGCASTNREPAPAKPAPAPASARGIPQTTRADPALWIDSDRVEGRARGELRWPAPLATLAFRPTHPVALEIEGASDDRGALELARSEQGRAIVLAPSRAIEGTMVLRYAVTFPPGHGEPTMPYAEPIELSVGGEDVFVLPELGEQRLTLTLRITTNGLTTRAASSFGLGVEQRIEASPDELRRGWYLAGSVGTAAFHAGDGDDLGVWLGQTRFDARWVSAELAGERSAIDAWIGRANATTAPPNVFAIVSTRRSSPPVQIAPRARGMLVSVDGRAGWTPAARILAAQTLAQRYIGGFLWVGERERPDSGRFFSEGFARAVAREALYEAGIIDPHDRADELNALLAALTFAEDAHRTAIARGALVATALDYTLARSGRRSESGTNATLQTFLRARLADAARDRKDSLGLDEFFAAVSVAAGESFALAAKATIERGAEIALPADIGRRCYRLVTAELVPFELGFATDLGEELAVTSVVHGSRAEAAGVRVGDVVLDLEYEDGSSTTPVRLKRKRGANVVPIEFFPAGKPRRGRQLVRIPRVPDRLC